MDLFETARLKIAFWYALIGLVILLVGGYLVYAYLIYIISDIIRIIQTLLVTNTLSQGTGTSLITQSINGDLTKMSVAVGIWILFTMGLSAYVLAEIILWPIRRAMERERQFIANVSHELRTPLSVMRTNSEVALMGADDATRDELMAAVASNLEEVDRMAKITQFLLNFSNIENLMAKTKLGPVDVRKVASDAVKNMETIAAKKNVALRCAADGASAVVNGNAVALNEMITNFLKNAIAYTPSGGRVNVTVTPQRGSFRSASTILLTVEDTGIGIPPEDMPKIFDAFYRGQNAAKNRGGTGLGLAIAREIIVLHRGVVAAKSAPGQGTVISVRFPAFSQ